MARDRAVLTTAARQHGVISSPQLAAAGLSVGWIKHRVARGWLRRLHRGVYLVGPLEVAHSRAMAAVLACGDDALLSHYASAVVWDWRPPRNGDAMHVTVTSGDRRRRNGIHIHRATLHPADLTRRHGIPITSAGRTLLDIAATEPTAELDRALNEAKLQRRVSVASLNEQFSRYPHHRGTTALRRATQADPGFTRSEAERRMLDLIRRAGLPDPEVNTRIHGYEVDFLWRERRLIVEVDGYDFHSPRRSFEQDRRRDQALVAAGLRVARVTWQQLEHEATRVATRLATALAA